MAESNEIVQAEQVQDPVMALALNKDVDVEKLRAIIAMKHEEEDRRAKRAYALALANFKAAAPSILKDKYNTQYKSKYTSIEALVLPCLPALSANGLAHRWEFPEREDGAIGVTCVLSHVDGHSESVTRWGQPDASGAKNALQQIKSTTTYLEIITFQAVVGIASSENAHVDDDAQSLTETITKKQAAFLHTRLVDTGSDEEKFCAVFGIESLDQLPESSYHKADMLLSKKEERILEDVKNAGA